MINRSNVTARRALKRFQTQERSLQREWLALLGDGAGNVAASSGRADYVLIRLYGSPDAVLEAKNTAGVQPLENVRVRVRRVRQTGQSRYEVVGYAPGTVYTSDGGLTTTAGVPPTVMGGDLSGYFPNPSVVRVNGNAVASTTPDDGQVWMWDDTAGQMVPTDLPAGGHTIQDEGSNLPARSKLNFIGANVSAADDSGNDRTNVTITSPTSGHAIQDEGTPLTARANLNFVGAGVAATDDAGNNATKVTIAGAHVIQDEGSNLPARSKLNFIGANVSAADDSGNDRTNVTVTVTGSGHTIQDEGVALTTRTNLNFVGDGIVAEDDSANDATKVTVLAFAHEHGLARWDGVTSQTTFDLPDLADAVDVVYVNGIAQDPLDYSLSPDGTQVVLASGLPTAMTVVMQYVMASI